MSKSRPGNTGAFIRLRIAACSPAESADRNFDPATRPAVAVKKVRRSMEVFYVYHRMRAGHGSAILKGPFSDLERSWPTERVRYMRGLILVTSVLAKHGSQGFAELTVCIDLEQLHLKCLGNSTRWDIISVWPNYPFRQHQAGLPATSET